MEFFCVPLQQLGENPYAGHLIAEKEAILRWVTVLNRPFLGLCLGYQLLADALGGTCRTMNEPEIAVTTESLTTAAADDPLFDGLAQMIPCIQWHGVEVVTLPRNTTVLA